MELQNDKNIHFKALFIILDRSIKLHFNCTSLLTMDIAALQEYKNYNVLNVYLCLMTIMRQKSLRRREEKALEEPDLKVNPSSYGCGPESMLIKQFTFY